MHIDKVKTVMAGSVAMILFMGMGANIAVPKPVTSKVASQYPPKEQEIRMEITAKERANPGVYWHQLDNGTFDADFTVYEGYEGKESFGSAKNTPMAGTCDQPYPKVAPFTYEVDLIKYLPKKFVHKGKNIPVAQLANKRLKKVTYFIDKEKDEKTYEPIGQPSILNAGQKVKEGEKLTESTTVKLTTKTGMSYNEKNYKEFAKRPNGCPKMSMFYETPLDVTWAGDLIQKKFIDVTPNSQLAVGASKPLNAKIVTVTEDKKKKYSDVTKTTETKWVSENPAIATVDSNGKVTAKKKGTTKVRAIWKKENYHISSSATIAVGEKLNASNKDEKSSRNKESYEDSEFPPDRYTYELDFEVISIDGKTVEQHTQTTTKVMVRRLSFADNRNQAKEAIQQDIDTRKEQKQDLEQQVRELQSDINYEYRTTYPDYDYISSLRSRITDVRAQINRLSRQIAHYEKEKNKLLTDEAKNQRVTTKLVIELDGAKQSTAQTITLSENETKTYTFNWNLPNSGTVEGIVNPDQNKCNGFEEQTFDNNSRSTPIYIASHQTVTAVDQATAFVEGIVRTLNDEKNGEKVYKEKVTTKLNIPDYHKKRRAGFGWDYTIVTQYVNEDPESKAIGSEDVRSYFPNQVENLPYRKQTWQSPEGNLNLSGLEVELENVKTSGERAKQRKEWKLPVYYVEQYSGKIFTNPKASGRNDADKLLNGGRKWYTHFDHPYGTYPFQSLLRDAGVNKLNTNMTGNIEIDGVILGSISGNDDYVKRSVTPNQPFPAGVGWNWQGRVNLLTRLKTWYNEWVAHPKDRPLNQYAKTYFVTPKDLAKIREYNKSMNDKYILGKSVLDVLPIKKTKER